MAAYLGTVTVEAWTLETKSGGRSAKGSAPQDGQTIFGSRGAPSGGACRGGNGGPGGVGGIGGGGAGGSSLALVYKGRRPTTDAKTDSSVATGKKGSGDQHAGGSVGIGGAKGLEVKIP